MKRRGKQSEKHKAHIKSLDFYKYYRNLYLKALNKETNKEQINKNSQYYVEYSLFNKIIDEFNLAIRDEILYETFDFNIPYRMGILGIRKRKLTPWFNAEGKLINPLPIDWKATNDLWDADEKARNEKKLVRHYNKHTNGYVAKWFFSTRKATFKWKSAYAFIPCRTAKVELGKILTDPNNKVDFYVQ